MAKASAPATRNRQHSAKLPPTLDARVRRCMEIEGITKFAEFARIAITRRCREIERENHIDADGKPLR